MKHLIARLMILIGILVLPAICEAQTMEAAPEGWRDLAVTKDFKVQMSGNILCEGGISRERDFKGLKVFEYYLLNDVKRSMHYMGDYDDKAGVATYALSWTEFFAGRVKFKSAEQLLESARAECLKEAQQVVNPGTGIKIDDHPGYQVEFGTTTRFTGAAIRKTVRLYVVKNRVYQLSYSGGDTDTDHANRQKFFDSFELVKD